MMKTTSVNTKYNELLSAEEMHNNSKKWLSELNFVKDEQQFFKELIASYTVQLIDKAHFAENKKVINALNDSKTENEKLLKIIRKHENNLEVIVDEMNQFQKEDVYKNEHKELDLIIQNFLKDYKFLKLQLFDIIKSIKKTEKQKRLLN